MEELNGHPLDEVRSLNGSSSMLADDARSLGRHVIPPPVPVDHTAAAALEIERARLESEIGAAQARLSAARRRTDEANEELQQLILSSKSGLADMEIEHERHVTMIREAARGEVERILDEARRRVGGSPSMSTSSEQRLADDVA